MKRMLLIALVCCYSIAYAQLKAQNKARFDPKEKTKVLVKIYNEHLKLENAQKILFSDKVEDYLILAHNARNTLQGQSKLYALTELEEKEMLEMQDVLTRPQYKLYQSIRPIIQPVVIANEHLK